MAMTKENTVYVHNLGVLRRLTTYSYVAWDQNNITHCLNTDDSLCSAKALIILQIRNELDRSDPGRARVWLDCTKRFASSYTRDADGQ
jgi:hypothetical protein